MAIKTSSKEKTKTKSSKEKDVKASKTKSSKEAKTSKSSKSEKKASTKEKTKRAKKEVPAIAPVKEKLNASQLMEHLAEQTGLDKKQVKAVFTALSDTILGSVAKKGVGEFTLPKLLKVIVKDVPARKARKGISPFTGEETVFKAKPASRKVKVRPMKTLKDAAM